MKSKIFTLILVLIGYAISAQNTETTLAVRPSTGDFGIELNFLPFSENGPIDLKTFRGKYFLSNKLALRTGFNFDHQKQTDEYPRKFMINDNDVMKFDKFDMKYTLWGINAGIEYHVLQNSRVSPYFGFDLGFETKSSKYNDEVNYYEYNYPYEGSLEIRETEIENAWWVMEYYYNEYGEINYVNIMGERAYTAWNANLIAGTDIYILKHFYAGVELGLGMQNIKYKEVTIKEDGVISSKYPEKKDSAFGLNYNSAIRIGFWF